MSRKYVQIADTPRDHWTGKRNAWYFIWNEDGTLDGVTGSKPILPNDEVVYLKRKLRLKFSDIDRILLANGL